MSGGTGMMILIAATSVAFLIIPMSNNGASSSSSSSSSNNHVYYKTTDGSKVWTQKVPAGYRDWNVPYPEYRPTYYMDPNLWTEGTRQRENWADRRLEDWADNLDIHGYVFNAFDKEAGVDRRSGSGRYKIDANGYPLNPKGRTGFTGRGRLGKWGPNHFADTAVTRWNEHHQLELVMVKRADDGTWALPGGHLNARESVTQALKREFWEEALDSNRDDWKTLDIEGFWTDSKGYDRGVDVFTGQGDGAPVDPDVPKVDDGGPKVATDNAWGETTVRNYHDRYNIFALNKIELKAGDDAVDAKWVVLDEYFWTYTPNVFKPHKHFIPLIAARHGVYVPPPPKKNN